MLAKLPDNPDQFPDNPDQLPDNPDQLLDNPDWFPDNPYQLPDNYGGTCDEDRCIIFTSLYQNLCGQCWKM